MRTALLQHAYLSTAPERRSEAAQARESKATVGSYKPLARHYIDHRVVNHSAGEYVRGDVYTNTIEGAFGNMKTGMRGVYKKVSPRYLQSYLDEYAWRHNAKREGAALFKQLLARATV